MARTKSSHLTDAELRLMQILWQRGPSTVAEVAEEVAKITPLAYSTVLTTLLIPPRGIRQLLTLHRAGYFPAAR